MNARRAWLYARVSTRKKSQEQSPERQLATLRRVAQDRGWSVVGDGVDRLSGKGLERPELATALGALQARKADVLVVHSLARLGRNLEDMVATARAIGDWGADIYIHALALDTGQHRGALGRFVFNVFATVDQAIREFGSEAILEGLEYARSKGKVLGRRRVVVPEGVVLEGAELRAQGLSWRAIRKRLVASHWSGVPNHGTLRRAVLEAYKNPPHILHREPAAAAGLKVAS